MRGLPLAVRGSAADALCQRWAASRHPTLEALLVEGGLVARQPAELRVLSALKANRLELVDSRNARIAVALLLAAADADAEIAHRATDALGMTSAEAQEALCRRVVIKSGNERLWRSRARPGICRGPVAARRYPRAHRPVGGLRDVRLRRCSRCAPPTRPLTGDCVAALPNAARAAGLDRVGTDAPSAAAGSGGLTAMAPDEWKAVLGSCSPQAGTRRRRGASLGKRRPPLVASCCGLIADASPCRGDDREDYARRRGLAERCGRGRPSVRRAQMRCDAAGTRARRSLSLAVTPDGSLLASGSGGRYISLWRLPGGEYSATLPGHRGGVTPSPPPRAETLLVSASQDKMIRLWRLPERRAHVARLHGTQGHGSLSRRHPRRAPARKRKPRQDRPPVRLA